MKRIYRPLIAVATFILCLAIAEIALRIYQPVPDPYASYKYKERVNQYIKSEFPANLHLITEAEEELPGLQGRNLFTTNNLGFRGDNLTTPKPANEFRIFMVGGSTTECLYLDDSKALSRVLQDELARRAPANLTVKVYGAGKSGDASDDHVSMIAHRIVSLEPDLIVVFCGINDLTRSINNYDYLHYVKESSPEKIPLWGSLATEFQISRRIYYLFKGSSTSAPPFTALPLHTEYKKSAGTCAAMAESDQKPRVDLAAYANNLKTIVGVAKTHGTKLVLMTQQSTWNSSADPDVKNWHWVVCRSGRRYREDFMDQALESLNDQMRQVTEKNAVPLYDLARIMPKSREFFYDDVHFNNQGANSAGTKLAALIFEAHALDRP